MAKTHSEKNSIANAGVYYTAGRLSKMGYIALVTSRNTKSYDLFIHKEDGKSIPLQVKSSSEGTWGAVSIKDINRMNEELNEKIKCPFILVNLESDIPEFFVFNKNQMKSIIKENWLSYQNRKHSKEIKTHDIQIFLHKNDIVDIENYRDKWKNLIE